MKTEARICKRKLFHPHIWEVRINGRKWFYDDSYESFTEIDRGATVKSECRAISKKDMPFAVQLGFAMAWENNKVFLNERYSHRHSYGWHVLISNLQMKGDDIIVFSRGRRMGVTRLPKPENPLTNIPIATRLV